MLLLKIPNETGSNNFDLTELDHIPQPAREQISQFNISNVFFSDPIKNNIINDSLFNRLK